MSSLAIRKDCDCKDAPRLHIFMRAGSQTWLTRPPRHVGPQCVLWYGDQF